MTQDNGNHRKEREEAELANEAAPAMTSEMEQYRELQSRPRKWFGLILRYLVPLVFTVLLLWYLFRKVDFSHMMEIIREGVNLWWILLAMGISVVSHIIRAVRWRMQLSALGIKASLAAMICSIFGCYALNLVFPRLGEVWRCTYIAKREKAPFTTVLGSMVSERLTDTLSVICLTLFTLIVAFGAIAAFLTKYPVGEDILSLVTDPFVWLAVGLVVAIIITVFRVWRATPVISKILQWLHEIWLGFASLWKMRGKWLFALMTLGIWGCYYIQLYVAFYAFGFTRALCSQPSLAFGLTPCLVAFVISAIGMAIPSNGGLGPWNIAIMFGLSIYGIPDGEGAAFSIVQWSGQTVMLIILGLYTMAYLALSQNPIPQPTPSTKKSQSTQ